MSLRIRTLLALGLTLGVLLDGMGSSSARSIASHIIHRQGPEIVRQLWIAVAGLVFGLVVMLVRERLLFSRLRRLGHEIAGFGEASSAPPLTLSGRDELSHLAEKIDAMLSRLREGEERLRVYGASLEATVSVRTREIEHQAFHDKLTGLPNRALFMDRIELAIARANRTGLGLATFFIDLDNFKLVNDSLGHGVGDALLVAVARRLNDSVRPGDTVARLGGDEFTVLLEELAGPEETREVACRILDGLRECIDVNGHEIIASASIGIAFSAPAEASAERLMKNADTAMYEAKSKGKAAYALYDACMDEQVVERLELEAGLRKALELRQIEVVYQPLIDLRSGAIKGAEALARWRHPALGQIAPSRFIPIAEESGLIVSIGYWILEAACLQSVLWREELQAPEFTVSVNLSGRQLQRGDAVETIAGILRRTGLAAGRLKLEITESVLMKNRHEIAETMHRLKDLGVMLALDDFGTGHFSLSTLNAFPIDTLKIDRAFVSRLGDEAEALSVVEAIMALSRTMRMDVTAEGVETTFQKRVVRELGCETGQGYLFDPPLSAPDFGMRLASEGGLRMAA